MELDPDVITDEFPRDGQFFVIDAVLLIQSKIIIFFNGWLKLNIYVNIPFRIVVHFRDSHTLNVETFVTQKTTKS